MKVRKGSPVRKNHHRKASPPTSPLEPAARRIWEAAHDIAAKSLGEGRRAQDAAASVLNRVYESLGDRWIRKSWAAFLEPARGDRKTKSRRRAS